jgi:hypothetical protein
MRALRINPWTRTIEELDLDDDGEGAITYEALRAAVFPPPLREELIQHIDLGSRISAWIDEEGVMVDWDMQRFFALHPVGRPEQANHYAGCMVLTGSDCGSAVALPARITQAALKQSVKWLDAREVTCPAPKVYAQDPKTGEMELVHDGGTWTYDNRPN